MPPRQQPRRTSRELALLSLSQIKGNDETLEQQDLDNLVLAAIRTLTSEVHDVLETAAAEVTRGNDQLFKYETRATTLESGKAMIKEAIDLTQKAINRLATALDLPETINLSGQYEVRQYALELIGAVHRRRIEIDQKLESVLVDWHLSRLPKIDQDILRIAVAEMLFLDVPQKVAINEAIELAKRYSDEEGYRFINGVLRRFTERLKTVNPS
ncbi:transcription antitermination factor NusB [Aphanothece sacrum]|uniref:Transcription antitermination protein NusB n=1 Tax=Aphanothece sacrum FPU1 TaxID=1920663 RepID=A0A401IJE8_APHSA|nr:transcription antitermination factor NusB [Aphanothece sacrum]GBF81300.1 N utilization substance protein B [Aphanothece sacrum FPU1]GBF83350.1 N utilization substance protein B [Aphanothece sacrum FPU3]